MTLSIDYAQLFKTLCIIRSIEENSLKPLKRNGLILSYEKRDGLHGVKYEILLPDKKQRGIEGPEKTIEGLEK